MKGFIIAVCFLVLVALTLAQDTDPLGIGQCQNNNERCNNNGKNCCNQLRCVNNRCRRDGGSGPGGNDRCIDRDEECERNGRRECCRNLQCKKAQFGNRKTCQR